ncbi:integron integrase [Geobacter sp.]|uniref:integron integrase n=1 Tax=Geobacter sp. TaxID=46610 RepID=UPI002610F7E1|nr:integron integrase [Geobacter sp.]
MKAGEALKIMREVMMLQHKSRNTIKTYLHWAAKFVAFLHDAPAGRSREENVIAFLTRLAVNEHVSASTQKQALCAVVYLYKRAIKKDLGDISEFTRATKYQYIPAVFSREEVGRVLDHLDGIGALWGEIMYGCGLRLGEVCGLRVKDIDLDRRQITVRQAKGNKDRTVPLPDRLVDPIAKHLRRLQPVYENYARRRVPVAMPDRLDRKYPNAPFEWGWFWVFPANEPVKKRTDRFVDPRWIGKLWHVHDTAVQKRIGRAIRAAGITKKAGCHTFRHSFATHWLESAGSAQEVAIIRLQRLLGHSSPKTTMIYLHCIKQQSDVPSPLDTLRRAA